MGGLKEIKTRLALSSQI